MKYNEENTNRRSWITFGIRTLLVVAVLFLLLMLYPIIATRFGGNQNGNEALLSGIFNTNIEAMQRAAVDYFINDRLPKQEGDMICLTLADMEGMQILVPFKDRTNNYCDKEASRVCVTKIGDYKYRFETFLSCPSSNEEDTLVRYRGCKDLCPDRGCKVTKDIDRPKQVDRPAKGNQTAAATQFLMRRPAEFTTSTQFRARIWIEGQITEYQHRRSVCHFTQWVVQPETTTFQPNTELRRLVSRRTVETTNVTFTPWVLGPETTEVRPNTETNRLHSTRTVTTRTLTGFTPWSANKYWTSRPTESNLLRVIGQTPNCGFWIFQTREPIYTETVTRFFRYETRERRVNVVTTTFFTFETRNRICAYEYTWSSNRTLSGWTFTGRTRTTNAGNGRWRVSGWVDRATYEALLRAGYRHYDQRTIRTMIRPETFRWFDTRNVPGWIFTGQTR